MIKLYEEFFNDCDYSDLKYDDDEKEIFFNHKKSKK